MCDSHAQASASQAFYSPRAFSEELRRVTGVGLAVTTAIRWCRRGAIRSFQVNPGAYGRFLIPHTELERVASTMANADVSQASAM